MTSAAPAVRLTDVRLDRGQRTILSDLSLSVPTGSITAVLGPSGSGKSTLLAALTGELQPARGTVEVFGQTVPTGSRALLDMRKSIGVLLDCESDLHRNRAMARARRLTNEEPAAHELGLTAAELELQ